MNNAKKLTMLLCVGANFLMNPAHAVEINPSRVTTTAVIYSGDVDGSRDPSKPVVSTIEAPLETMGSRRRAASPRTLRSGTPAVQIFDAHSQLLVDFDGDGFAPRFSLRFDADTLPGRTAGVYAEVFISLNGGPWNRFHTTDIFVLTGQSAQDSVEMISDLDDGYPSGYYDLLVELYEAQTGQFLTDYGPEDAAGLYGLPLEDAYADGYYHAAYTPYSTDIYVETYGGGGSGDLILLTLIGLALFARSKSVRRAFGQNRTTRERPAESIWPGTEPKVHPQPDRP